MVHSNYHADKHKRQLCISATARGRRDACDHLQAFS